ncbi:hypothetical protein VNI00_018141 [Paramarasmius palmivorus]|uniref:Alpha-type protein kinase domain-containing protein n=1 Tax=Paramarasmius palmivorus TaxID=297713 RepID=A0AAW0B1K0_9AGAR
MLADFTADVIAHTDIKCQRGEGCKSPDQTIKAGEKFAVVKSSAGGADRRICLRCEAHYTEKRRKKLEEEIREKLEIERAVRQELQLSVSSSSSSAHRKPNINEIDRLAANARKSGSTPAQRQVKAMSNVLPPPHELGHIGYNVNHVDRPLHMARWASSGFSSSAFQTELRIKLMHMHEGKDGKGTLIDARTSPFFDCMSSTEVLIQKAEEVASAQLNDFDQDYQWEIGSMSINAYGPKGCDLRTVPRHIQYIFQTQKFYKKNQKTGKLDFKPPNMVEICICISASDWNNYMFWKARNESSKNTVAESDVQSLGKKALITLTMSQRQPIRQPIVTHREPSEPNASSKRSRTPSVTGSLSTSLLPLIKHRKDSTNSSSDLSNATPEQFRNAITHGGTSQSFGTTGSDASRSIKITTIMIFSWHDLISGETSWKGQVVQGKLWLPKKPKEYGRGAFKVAFHGCICFEGGTRSMEKEHAIDMVVKRVIVPGSGQNGIRLRYYGSVTEAQRISTEALTLSWATSLTYLALDIAQAAAKHMPPPQPLLEPKFVTAIVAEDKDSAQTFLIEDIIYDPFVKFISNRIAQPLFDKTDNLSHYNTAQFFCFLQHVQMAATMGNAFVSDWQGSENLLTDPQVMTRRPVNANSNHGIFGDGNLSDAVDCFPGQHQCNQYCDWFSASLVVGDVTPEKEVIPEWFMDWWKAVTVTKDGRLDKVTVTGVPVASIGHQGTQDMDISVAGNS